MYDNPTIICRTSQSKFYISMAPNSAPFLCLLSGKVEGGGGEAGGNKTANSATLLQSGAGRRVGGRMEEIVRTKSSHDFLCQHKSLHWVDMDVSHGEFKTNTCRLMMGNSSIVQLFCMLYGLMTGRGLYCKIKKCTFQPCCAGVIFLILQWQEFLFIHEKLFELRDIDFISESVLCSTNVVLIIIPYILWNAQTYLQFFQMHCLFSSYL